MKIYHKVVTLITLIILTFSATSNAQKVKDEELKFYYHKLPSAPLNASISNYQSSVFAAYEANNEKLRQDYTAKVAEAKALFNKRMAEHPAKVKDAQARYDKEMEEYRKLDAIEKMAERVATGSAPVKPYLQLPSEPYYVEPTPPVLVASYDYDVLASSHIKLYGFNRAPENAVKISVTMFGFDMTDPRVTSEQRSYVEKGVSSQRTYFSLEYSYRHPMAVKVELPDGTVLLNETPAELNNYVNVKTSGADRAPSFSKESLIKNLEEKMLQKNLNFINSRVNDLYGYGLEERKVEISYAKGEEYIDLMQAFNEFSSAVSMLENNEKEGLEAINHPIEVWEKNFAQYVPNTKKAHIDEDLAIILAFNLLEGYFLRREDDKMTMLISKLNSMSLSNNKRKIKTTYDLILTDLKKRKAAQPG